jgi:hypothetical protein
MKNRLSFFLPIVAAVAFVGVGCRDVSTSVQSPSGPKPATFENLSPQDAAKKVMFVGGNVILMKQGFGGIGGKLAQKLGFGGSEGIREIVVKSFAPAQRADIDWKLTTKVTPDPKDPKDSGTRQTTGQILGGKLLSAHKLYLPGYWTEGEKSALDTSIIWLSQDVYDDLSKNHVSTLDLGVIDETIAGSLAAAKDLQAALAKLTSAAEAVGVRKDVYLMEADMEPSTYTLKINGTDVKVQVITARSWFGEITVLDNKQNPLVLKVTLNPIALAALNSMAGSEFFRNGLGYEITELKDLVE